MGRPSRYAPNEVRGTLERARHMIAIAPQALDDVGRGPKENFTRFVRREPLGVVFTVAAWNYPYLIAVNSVVPALMAGNAVVLKHSAQTPLAAERFAECLDGRGIAEGRVPGGACLARRHRPASSAIRAWTSSRSRARSPAAMPCSARRRRVSSASGLELGGCDPVYVRHDANLEHAIENIVDGAYFNSGQSCCGLQRVYVHDAVYQKFTEGFVELTRKYALGDPTDAGHHARAAGAHGGGRRRARADRGVDRRGRERRARRDRPSRTAQAGTPYLAPQVLLDVEPRACRSCARRSSGPSPAS